MLKGVAEGKGKIITKEGYTYEGEFADNMTHG